MFIKIKKGTYYVEPNDPPGIYNLNKWHKKYERETDFRHYRSESELYLDCNPCSPITICAKFPLFNIKGAECALL